MKHFILTLLSVTAVLFSLKSSAQANESNCFRYVDEGHELSTKIRDPKYKSEVVSSDLLVAIYPDLLKSGKGDSFDFCVPREFRLRNELESLMQEAAQQTTPSTSLDLKIEQTTASLLELTKRPAREADVVKSLALFTEFTNGDKSVNVKCVNLIGYGEEGQDYQALCKAVKTMAIAGSTPLIETSVMLLNRILEKGTVASIQRIEYHRSR